MAETSGFFDSVYDESTGSYDIEYFADQFASYFSLFIGNGVFGNPTNQLRVLSTGGMSVKVRAGFAFINGYWYKNDEELTIPVTPNLSSVTRTDSVICRWDSSERKISVIYQVASTDITRDESYYDLRLATVSIPPRVSQIDDSLITDERPNESVCGFVTGVVRTETTEDLFAQYNEAFTTWFNNAKGQIDGDMAIKLQLEFSEIANDFIDIQEEFDEVLRRPVIVLSDVEPSSIPDNTIVFVYE